MFFISFYLFLPQIFEEYSTDQFTHFALSSSNSLYFSLKALKEYSTLLFCCYISFYISPYISFSLSPSLSLSSPFSPPPYSFISLSPPLFTLHSHSIVKHSNIIQVVAGGLQSNITTTHNRTHRTHATPSTTPHFYYSPTLPLLPCVSLSIKRNLVLISCLLLLLKFIEPILIFYLLQHAQHME